MSSTRAGAATPPASGGVVLSYRDDDDRPTLVFIAAHVAARLTPLTCLIDVPGARPPVRGLALADGEVITVLELGKRAAASAAPAPFESSAEWPVPGADRAVLCLLGSVRVALIGATVVATGVFDPMEGGGGVLFRGAPVPTLDVRALYACAEAAIWADRAVSSRPSAPPTSPSRAPARRSSPPPPRASGPPGDRS
jgi:hypothetical protein